VLAATCQQAVGFQMQQQRGQADIFETVIVDEAARANPLDLFIPMSLAERRIILVGDHRQLPHILDQEVENDLEAGVQEKTRDVLKKSLFERLFAQLRERERADGIKRTVTLDTQYRMHPALGRFVSDTFYKPYGESFESGLDIGEFSHDVDGYGSVCAAWVNIPYGKGAECFGRSKSRRSEASWVAAEAHRIMEAHQELSVGIITFYAAQVSEIERQMARLGVMAERPDGGGYVLNEGYHNTRNRAGKLVERFRVGTVDAFQGKEFDVVLLSMTRSNSIVADSPKKFRLKYGHLMLENRLCVAMSRHQRLLIVVGDTVMLQAGNAEKAIPGLCRFYDFCEGEYGTIVHS